MPKFVQDQQGNVWEDQGGGMGRKLSTEEVGALSQNPLETLGQSAAVSAAQAYLGGKQLLGDEGARRDLAIANRMQEGMSNVNPVSAFAGQAAPAVGVGLATGGMGVIPTMAAEAGMGALYAPDNPGMGAAIGAAAGGLPFAAPAVMAGGRALAREFPDMADPFLRNMQGPTMGAMPIRPGQGVPGIAQPNMAGRVMQNIDAATPEAPPGQYYKGLMRSSDLEQQGVPLTPAMRTALDATDSAQADYAKKMLWREGLQGVGEQEKRAQRQYMTNLVKQEMGVTEDVALTDSVLNHVLKTEGQNIGRVLQSKGPIDVPPATMEAMRGIVEAAETGWQGSLSNVVKNLESSIERTGSVSAQAYQNAITRLNEIGAPGRSAGAIMDAKKMREEISRQVEGRLSKAEQQLLAESRYRYKLAKTARQGRGVGSDMMINPATFGANWDRKIGQTARGQDRVGRAADTLNFLSTMEANAGTTLQRNIAMLPGAVQRAAPTAALSTLGMSGLVGGYNMLFGGK